MVLTITEEERLEMFPIEVSGLYFLFSNEEEQQRFSGWLNRTLQSSTPATVAHQLSQAVNLHLDFEDKENPKDTIEELQKQLNASHDFNYQLEQDNRKLASQLEQTKGIVDMYKELNLKGDSEIVKELLGTIKDLTMQLIESNKSTEQKLTDLSMKAISEISDTAKSMMESSSGGRALQPVQPLTGSQSTQPTQPLTVSEPVEPLQTLTDNQPKEEDSIPSLADMQSTKKTKLVPPKKKIEPILKVDESKMVNTQAQSKEPTLEEIIARNKKLSGS